MARFILASFKDVLFIFFEIIFTRGNLARNFYFTSWSRHKHGYIISSILVMRYNQGHYRILSYYLPNLSLFVNFIMVIIVLDDYSFLCFINGKYENKAFIDMHTSHMSK